MGGLESVPGWLLLAAAGALGLAVGSFLNVVIHRLPRGESVVRPRSRCPGCGRPIPAWENVPLVSFALLRGRCRGCGARIAWRYPAIELATGLVFAAILQRLGPTAATPLAWALAAALIAAAVIDFEHRIIPDEISLGGLAVALVLTPLVEWHAGMPPLDAVLRSLLGAALGGGLLWIVGFAHARVSVATGRTYEHWPAPGEAPPRPASLDYWTWFPGVGFGDVKLLAMIGAVLGPVGAVETILVAAGAGLVLGLGFAVATRRWNAPFGFGPAIAFGALVALLVPLDLV
jgi:leader peptidase (prepilin peptidase)/N-methyltransferase